MNWPETNVMEHIFAMEAVKKLFLGCLIRADVLHTVGPRYNKESEQESKSELESCYKTCLKIVEDKGLRSVVSCTP